MAILKKIFIALIVLVAGLAVIGFFLPTKFKIERSVTIAAPAEKIYPMISETRKWPTWTVWNERDPNMKIDYAGPASGTGAKWAWQSKSEGNGSMEFTSADVSQGIGYKLVLADVGMTSSGVLSMSPAASGTKIIWTNEGEFGGNPFMRYFGLVMDRMVGKDYEAGLAKLKKLVEADIGSAK
jgi:Polyketide cyclase / dehydrase and lipid transport